MIKIPTYLSFVIVFHVKIQHKTIYLSFCIVFASIKLPQQGIPKTNYRLNETIFFFVIVLCRFRSMVKKLLPQTLDPELSHGLFNKY